MIYAQRAMLDMVPTGKVGISMLIA